MEWETRWGVDNLAWGVVRPPEGEGLVLDLRVTGLTGLRNVGEGLDRSVTGAIRVALGFLEREEPERSDVNTMG